MQGDRCLTRLRITINPLLTLKRELQQWVALFPSQAANVVVCFYTSVLRLFAC